MQINEIKKLFELEGALIELVSCNDRLSINSQLELRECKKLLFFLGKKLKEKELEKLYKIVLKEKELEKVEDKLYNFHTEQQQKIATIEQLEIHHQNLMRICNNWENSHKKPLLKTRATIDKVKSTIHAIKTINTFINDSYEAIDVLKEELQYLNEKSKNSDEIRKSITEIEQKIAFILS